MFKVLYSRFSLQFISPIVLISGQLWSFMASIISEISLGTRYAQLLSKHHINPLKTHIHDVAMIKNLVWFCLRLFRWTWVLSRATPYAELAYNTNLMMKCPINICDLWSKLPSFLAQNTAHDYDQSKLYAPSLILLNTLKVRNRFSLVMKLGICQVFCNITLLELPSHSTVWQALPSLQVWLVFS